MVDVEVLAPDASGQDVGLLLGRSVSIRPNPQFDYRMGGAGAAYRSSKAALNALTICYAQAQAQAPAADGSFKVNALAPGLRATNLNSRAAECGGDPAEAEAQAVIIPRLPADWPVGGFFP